MEAINSKLYPSKQISQQLNKTHRITKECNRQPRKIIGIAEEGVELNKGNKFFISG